MSNHVLIDVAKRKPYTSTPEMPKRSKFDHKRGVWLRDNEILIGPNSEFGVQATKKCDVETGEDQKGS